VRTLYEFRKEPCDDVPAWRSPVDARTGKRNQGSGDGHRTKAEAQANLSEILPSVQTGNYEPGRQPDCGPATRPVKEGEGKRGLAPGSLESAGLAGTQITRARGASPI
jgi:hypothetical protein